MRKYQIKINNVWIDITAHVIPKTVSINKSLYTDLKSNSNSIDFELSRNNSVYDDLLSSDEDVQFSLSDGVVYLFMGYLSDDWKLSVSASGKSTVKVTAEDYTNRKLKASWTSTNGVSTKFNGATVSSVISTICNLAGIILDTNTFIDAELQELVCFSVLDNDKKTYYDILTPLLLDFGYTYKFSGLGILTLYRLRIEGDATYIPIDGVQSVEISKSRKKYEKIEIKWTTLKTLTNKTVYQDTTNGSSSNSCLIPVSPRGKYPEGSSSASPTLAEYRLETGEKIITTEGVVFTCVGKTGVLGGSTLTPTFIDCDTGVKVSVFNYDWYNICSITKLKGVASSVIVEGDATVTLVPAVATGNKKFVYESKYINTLQQSENLGDILYSFYSNLNYNYTVKATANLTLGALVTLSEGTFSGISQNCRVVTKTETLAGFTYQLQAVGAFSVIEKYADAKQNQSAQSSIAARPTFEELTSGLVLIGQTGEVSDVTAPTVPVFSTITAKPNGTVDLTFNASVDTESGVASYKIYRLYLSQSFSVIATVVDDGQESYVFTDDTLPNRSNAWYRISAVDKRGNESGVSTGRNIDSLVTILPYDPLTLAAVADNADFIKLSATVDSTDDPLYKADTFLWYISKNSGSTYALYETSKSLSSVYYFNRSNDGYPEKTALANYRFKLKVKSVYGNTNTGDLVSTPVYTSYLTWIPLVPVLSTRASGRNCSLATDKQDMYGNIEYEIQISKDNTNWYSPAANLNAYASEDNWKTGVLNGSLLFPNESFSQGLPLTGQNLAIPVVVDTLYYYRVSRNNKTTGVKSAKVSTSIIATATSAKDVVNNAISTAHIVDGSITALKIAVVSLSAINVNLGTITDGALGNNSNNKWDLSAGTFKIGDGVNNILSFDSVNGLKIKTSNFESAALATKIAGDFSVGTGIGTGLSLFVDPDNTSYRRVIAYGRSDNAINDASSCLELQSLTGSVDTPVGISFHRANYYASKIILDTDNYFHFGGWSAGANSSGIKCGAIRAGQWINGTAWIDAHDGYAFFGCDSENGLKVNYAGNVTALSYGFNTAGVTLDQIGGLAARISSPYGNVQIGPQNASYCHFITDLASFYFNKQLVLNGDISKYDPGALGRGTLSGYNIDNLASMDGERWNTDFNTRLKTGFHNDDSGSANTPGIGYAQLIVARGIDTGLQIAGGYMNDNLYFRGWGSSGTVWTPWRVVIHSGNIASQSVANANTVGGLAVSAGRNNVANNIVRTDASGYIQTGYINSSQGGDECNVASPAFVWGRNATDNYLRTYATTSLNVGSATSISGVIRYFAFSPSTTLGQAYASLSAYINSTVGADCASNGRCGTDGVGLIRRYSSTYIQLLSVNANHLFYFIEGSTQLIGTTIQLEVVQAINY